MAAETKTYTVLAVFESGTGDIFATSEQRTMAVGSKITSELIDEMCRKVDINRVFMNEIFLFEGILISHMSWDEI